MGILESMMAQKMGGGASSWDEMKDCPFYDTRKTEEVTIEWDGNTEGKYFIDPLGDRSMVFCKVSDITPAVEDLVGCNVTVVLGGEEITTALTEDFVISPIDGVVTIGESGFVVYTAPITFDGVEMKEVGTYFMSATKNGQAFRVIKLSYNAQTGELKQLEPKFVEGMYYTETSRKVIAEGTFDTGSAGQMSVCGQMEGTLELGKEYTVIVNGVEYHSTCVSVFHDSEGYDCLGLNVRSAYNPVADWSNDDGVEGDIPYGLWIHPIWPSNIEVILSETLLTFPVTVQIVGVAEEVHTIDPKYLPMGGGPITLYWRGRSSNNPDASLTGYDGDQLTTDDAKMLVKAFREGRTIVLYGLNQLSQGVGRNVYQCYWMTENAADSSGSTVTLTMYFGNNVEIYVNGAYTPEDF